MASSGRACFSPTALAQLTFAGTRFAAGLGIGLAGGDAAAVMAGVAVATVLTLVLTALPERDLWGAAESTKGRRLATLPNAAAATGLTILMALATIDVLVAKLVVLLRATPAHTASHRSARVCSCSCRSASSPCSSRGWQRSATVRASAGTCSPGSASWRGSAA